MINLLSLTIFPFVAKPMMQKNLDLDELQFRAVMEQRKKEIPKFIINAIKSNNFSSKINQMVKLIKYTWLLFLLPELLAAQELNKLDLIQSYEMAQKIILLSGRKT